MAEDGSGFFSRWSQRKQALRAGVTVPELPVIPAAAARATPESMAPPVAEPVEVQTPPPTLADVQALTAQSDFARYMASDVDPAVKNAAMKKLFADPHFNVMDRMDVYIDDYNRPDPLPPSMLRQMASAKFLQLFDEQTTGPATEAASLAVPQGPQPSSASQTQDALDHEHPDLRLQQDHAPGPQGPGRGVA